MRKIIFTLIIMQFALSVAAQNYRRSIRYVSVGGILAAMNYVGELDPSPGILSPSVLHTRPDLGINIMKRLTPRTSYRVSMSYGRISGSDAQSASYNSHDIYRKARNLSFRNDIFELKADAVFDLFENRRDYEKRPDYTPYLFAGIAYFHHNPMAKTPDAFGNHWVALRPMKLEGRSYSLNQISLPVGVGFRYKLGKRWDLAFEMGCRFTLTDYLDDVSGHYVDRGTFGDNPLAVAMADRSMEGLQHDPSLAQWVAQQQGVNNANGYNTINGFGRSGDQRGDYKRKDVYIVTGFQLNYIITDILCPKFR